MIEARYAASSSEHPSPALHRATPLICRDQRWAGPGWHQVQTKVHTGSLRPVSTVAGSAGFYTPPLAVRPKLGNIAARAVTLRSAWPARRFDSASRTSGRRDQKLGGSPGATAGSRNESKGCPFYFRSSPEPAPVAIAKAVRASTSAFVADPGSQSVPRRTPPFV